MTRQHMECVRFSAAVRFAAYRGDSSSRQSPIQSAGKPDALHALARSPCAV